MKRIADFTDRTVMRKKIAIESEERRNEKNLFRTGKIKKTFFIVSQQIAAFFFIVDPTKGINVKTFPG